VDYRDDAAEADFRGRLRTWLSTNALKGGLPSTDDEYWAHAAEWHTDLYNAGWFGVSFPARYGGQGLSPVYEAIVDDELAWAGAPPKPSLGYIVHGMLRHASVDICERFLPSMIAGTERWCQGFSEPEAGSDLAGLRTSAVRDGDEYIINGHKVWTSYSDVADWCILLARTDSQAPKHKGLTAFAMPMDQPGVTQRPLKMINGVSNEFGELLLEDARIPAANRITELGGGWAMAMTVLNHERSPADLGYTARYSRIVRELERHVGAQPRVSSLARHALGNAYVNSEVLRMHVKRRLSERLSDHEPGPEGAIDKLLMTTTEQTVGNAARQGGIAGAFDGSDSSWLNIYLYSRAATVMGGTSQIQKNVIASQILKLPNR
jgi:alkylation response protein AidB-like acyl-CoA dehydrogenase